MVFSDDAERPHQLGRKHSVTHEQIITSAWTLFEKKGYDKTRTADIAAAVGISKRSLFNYFEAKEALLFPESKDFFAAFKTELDKRPQSESLLDSCKHCLINLHSLMEQPSAGMKPGPEVLRARLTDPALRYSRDLWAAEMNQVVADRLGTGEAAAIKAGFVSAIVAQAWTEAIRIARESDSRVTPQAAVPLVVDSLGELLK